MSPASAPFAMNRIIIFDWDDTICPSSFIDQWKVESLRDLPLHFQNLFHEIGKTAERCLNAAGKCGEVLIITNSDEGWVKFSAERFVPNLLPCLDRYKIVSARTQYERFYPNQPLCWKAAAFAHEVNEQYASNDVEVKRSSHLVKARLNSEDSNDSMISTDVSSNDDEAMEISSSSPPSKKKPLKLAGSKVDAYGHREIMSFGDSMEERRAVKIAALQLMASPKSVMFISNPSPMQIIGQLTMIAGHMAFLCRHGDSIDLEISPHQAQNAAELYFQKGRLINDRHSHEAKQDGATHYADSGRIRRVVSSQAHELAVSSLNLSRAE